MTGVLLSRAWPRWIGGCASGVVAGVIVGVEAGGIVGVEAGGVVGVEAGGVVGVEADGVVGVEADGVAGAAAACDCGWSGPLGGNPISFGDTMSTAIERVAGFLSDAGVASMRTAAARTAAWAPADTMSPLCIAGLISMPPLAPRRPLPLRV